MLDGGRCGRCWEEPTASRERVYFGVGVGISRGGLVEEEQQQQRQQQQQQAGKEWNGECRAGGTGDNGCGPWIQPKSGGPRQCVQLSVAAVEWTVDTEQDSGQWMLHRDRQPTNEWNGRRMKDGVGKRHQRLVSPDGMSLARPTRVDLADGWMID